MILMIRCSARWNRSPRMLLLVLGLVRPACYRGRHIKAVSNSRGRAGCRAQGLWKHGGSGQGRCRRLGTGLVGKRDIQCQWRELGILDGKSKRKDVCMNWEGEPVEGGGREGGCNGDKWQVCLPLARRLSCCKSREEKKRKNGAMERKEMVWWWWWWWRRKLIGGNWVVCNVETKGQKEAFGGKYRGRAKKTKKK
ncbi:hypothetical protein LY78DRAFT_407824 [Colletotrichum sublineola]|nr:hypothetical protein LY78DRAFT_407824 [Colletotrichum sublineola]